MRAYNSVPQRSNTRSPFTEHLHYRFVAQTQLFLPQRPRRTVQVPRSTTDHGNNFNKSKITSLDHLVVTPVQPKQWEKYQTSQTCSAEICISTWRWWLHWLFTWCHSTPSRGRVFTKFSHYQNSFNHFLLKRRSSRRTLKYSDFSALCLPMSKTLSRVAVFSPRTA